MSDPLIIAGHEFSSRLFLGSAGYPNRKLMLDALATAQHNGNLRGLGRKLGQPGPPAHQR